MATIIYTDGTTKDVQPKNGADFKLDELQAIVDGLIEIVYLNGNRIMVINEEGLLDNLPINAKATAIAQNDSPYSYGVIVGDVLVCDNDEVQ